MNGKSDSKLIVPVERSTLGGERSAYSQESRTEAAGCGRSFVSVPVLARAEQLEPEELLHFFTASPDLLCIADFGGKLKRLNKTWQSLLGWTLEDLVARPFLDIVHPDDRTATHDEMAKSADGTSTVSFENRCRCKDGTWMWLHWTVSRRSDGPETYAVGRDITERKSMERKIASVLDSERNRMSCELHDGHCQRLTAISALCSALARRLPPEASSESALACEIRNLLGDAIQQVRDLARGLGTVSIGSVGLVKALADFCLNTGVVFGITCTFDHEPHSVRLNAHREAHLYRIAQEAVSNAITHGRAKTIQIRLFYRDDQGALSIHDDGVGIRQDSPKQSGIGLHTMSYRARLIGGSLEMKRLSPHGTAVTCVFRLPSAVATP